MLPRAELYDGESYHNAFRNSTQKPPVCLTERNGAKVGLAAEKAIFRDKKGTRQNGGGRQMRTDKHFSSAESGDSYTRSSCTCPYRPSAFRPQDGFSSHQVQ